MLRTRIYLFLFTAMLASVPAAHVLAGGHDDATVLVQTSRASGMVRISIQHQRRIGNVTIDVKDANGRTLYREEGKALSHELVRNIDKGMLPKGALTVSVRSRDFAIDQAFTVE
jgi:hypothetical protein